MAAITVRDLDDDVKRALAERAAAKGRSMEAEARHILTRAVVPRQRNIALSLMDTFGELGGVDDLPHIPRTEPARAAHIE